MKKYVSIDIGGTAIKYGLIREDGRILERRETPTQAELGGPAILEKADGLVRQFLKEQPSGICISTAGMVDPQKGEIFHSAPLIPRYAGTRFKAIMEERFAIPCQVENDVNCAGLAEYISGAGKGCNPMLMLTVGTGIGGCLISEGRIFHGFGNSACELGYMHLRGSDFQSLGSARALSRQVAERKGEPRSRWNGRRIFEQAIQGDEICVAAIDELIDVLGLGIANICYVVNPEAVILGGGIMSQEDYLKERLCQAVRRYLIEPMASHSRIGFAKYKNDAGMLGAFYHFMQRDLGGKS